MNSANVVCKQLGYRGGAMNYYGGARYGEGNGTIWLSNVTCNGNEHNLAKCPHSYWGKSRCTHDQDISVVCDPGNIRGNCCIITSLGLSNVRHQS